MFTGKVRSYDREKTKKKTWKPYFSDYADFDDCTRKRSFGVQHDLGCWKPAACSGEAGKSTGESCGSAPAAPDVHTCSNLRMGSCSSFLLLAPKMPLLRRLLSLLIAAALFLSSLPYGFLYSCSSQSSNRRMCQICLRQIPRCVKSFHSRVTISGSK